MNKLNFELSEPFSIVELGVQFLYDLELVGIRIIHIQINQYPPEFEAVFILSLFLRIVLRGDMFPSCIVETENVLAVKNAL